MEQLSRLGWNDSLQKAWNDIDESHFVPGRVIADYGSTYKVAMPEELSAEISGRLEYVSELHEMPKVGDWVALQPIDGERAMIQAVLPRKSEIGRKQPGEQFAKQVLATNVDIAFLVQALDHDFSPKRLQRYLFQLSNEGVEPVIVLNKADKEKDIGSKLKELATFHVRTIVASAELRTGIDEIASVIAPGATAVFMGSSGVGKSTIINLLLGEDNLSPQAIRETDSKGRHTTTHRELFALPNGGLVIDTPGLRELQLWGTEEDLEGVFTDIGAFAKRCKFNNCSHTSEPECAVRQAVVSERLDKSRLDSYFKFQKELQFLSAKVDEEAANERRQNTKRLQRHINQVVRSKNYRNGG